MARSRKRKKKGQAILGLPQLHTHAAGMDIGATEIFVAVPAHLDPEPVRRFETFTPDLVAMVKWLQQCGITTVAMESTGVYWIPSFDLLEQHSMQACLVNAEHVKRVPGRGTDFSDCQWLQFLHTVGLLQDSFHPPQQIRALRELRRHRDNQVALAAAHIQHMQKALDLMNLQIHHVISDLTGVTGMAIVDAILKGQHDPAQLATLRDPGIKASPETIQKSLTGNYQPHYIFMLRQARDDYQHYQRQIVACDQEMQGLITRLPARIDPQQHPIPAATNHHKKRQGNEYHFDIRLDLYRNCGVDLTQIPGIGTVTAATVLLEVGPDLHRFRSAAAFASWMGLCPAHEISGGKVLSRKTRKVKSRLAQAFRLAAQTLARSRSYLGDFYRRCRSRLGAPQAVTAAAHKLSRIVYHMLTTREPYDESVFQRLEGKHQQRQKIDLRRRAKAFGYALVPLPNPSTEGQCVP
jgi:transposase